ncbi:hypothetical protein BH11MYX3_BH11MYX3_32710 [soil metagenome]
MRSVALIVLTLAGCGFHVAGSGSGPSDGGPDAPLDSPLDAPEVLPACMTNPLYSAGPLGSKHRYRETSGVDYDGAIDACTDDGAHLVVVDDMPENLFVGAFAGEETYIGLDDLAAEGTFRWVNGSTSTFRGFAGAEPNDNGTEDCTYSRADGSWNDTKCEEVRHAVCECEVGYTPRPTPACRSMTTPTVHSGRKYFIHTAPLAWAPAKADCEATGAHLVTFSDNDEDDIVDKDFTGDSWIGLSDQATEGTFVWVNGDPLVFTHWDIASPHAASPGRNCVRVNLEWSDSDCTLTKPYACECEP